MKKITGLFILLFLAAASVSAQESPVSWGYSATRINAKEAIVKIRAIMDDGYHIYSQNIKPGGPSTTKIKFTPSKDYTLVGKTTEPKPVTYFDKNFKMDVSYFEGQVVFMQKVKLNAKTTVIKGTIDYTACNDKACLPPDDITFSIPVK